MRPIQILLAALLVFAAATYWIRRRSHTGDRLVMLAVLAAGLAMVAFPDDTSRLAALLGVGRGSDLVLYLGLLGLSYAGLLLYLRQRQVMSDITEIARLYAIDHRRSPAGGLAPSGGRPVLPASERVP
jgi:hypothetical protein